MSFDIEAARKAGYSPKEIGKFLREQKAKQSFDIEGARKAGYSEKEIKQAIQEKSKPSRIRSILSAPVKGLLKESAKVTESLSPFLGSSIIPFPEEYVESELLPTQEGVIEDVLERAGGIAPYLALGGGGAISIGLRSLLSSALAQAGKSVGGETGETVGELAGLGLPGLGRKIIPKASQKASVELGRRAGLTEKQIAPLIQNKKKSSILGKLAHKGEGIQKRLKGAREGRGRVYEFIKGTPAAKKNLGLDAMHKFDMDLQKGLKKLTPTDRKTLQPLIDEYKDAPFNGESLIDFYTKLNKYYSKGLKEAAILQQPIKTALKNAGGSLSKDFESARKMYGNLADLQKKLKPKMFDEYLKFGEYASLASAIFTGNASLATKVVGEHGARRLMSEMLTNPRFQNLTRQSLKAINQGRYAFADKLMAQMFKTIESKKARKEKEKLESSP